MGDTRSSATAYDDLLLKSFFAEVSEVERDNEVARILSCFKLNPFEYLNLPFEASPEDLKKQYRKLSLLVHPDKCKHPQAKEAFADKLREVVSVIIFCGMILWHNETGILSRWAGQCWIRHPDNFVTLLRPALVKLLEAIRLQCLWSSKTIFFCHLGTVMQELQWQKAERCREPLWEDSEGLKMMCRVLKQTLAKAQKLLLDEQERDYVLAQVNAAKEELRAKRKKQLKKDTASKIKSLVDEGKYDQQYEWSEEFQQELKLKVREILTDQEWRRRKMQMRVSSWRDFMKTGKKGKKGEIRPPKLKTEDPNKSYVQRPVKRG
ncbi:hypothetical protein POTOM_033920 [Populus tomentosa]|uniref:J domain-containing protein n=1 Tax=Populus tomentosa TaxID=118781 RepID=A0A8X7Z285_POPTO|nr:hypothetical protein POTOM_033920 [Populus tomentosa]